MFILLEQRDVLNPSMQRERKKEQTKGREGVRNVLGSVVAIEGRGTTAGCRSYVM